MSFDSHCHLTADAFDPDRDQVLDRAREAGVQGIVTIASTPDDARDALALARVHQDVWCTAGLHPHESGHPPQDWVQSVSELLDDPRVVAVGECGLEFHYDVAPADRQLEVLRSHVELAVAHDLPLVVHSRDADDAMIQVLRELPDGVRGVLHCFTGGDDLLDAGLAAGWYVSFSGIATFKRFTAHDQVRRVPAERILVETDAPYLAPVPFRGKRNEPAHVVHTTRVVAGIRGEAEREFATRVARNARSFYRLGQETR
ncbi:MAG: TatD family hydrolase [Gemmatimonadota bacterium]